MSPESPTMIGSTAEETSSGGERCTAGGAYCYTLATFLDHPSVDASRDDGSVEIYGQRDSETFPALRFCPWCGTKLGGDE